MQSKHFCRDLVAVLGLCMFFGNDLRAQTSPEMMRNIMDRLDALQKQNEELLAQIAALRAEVQSQTPQASNASTPEQTAVDEARITELQQTKVEASQKFPVTLTGMVLFDASSVTGTNNNFFQAAYGEYGLGIPSTEAAFNQSILGLRFDGPRLGVAGRISGFVSMDFFGGGTEYASIRLRRAGISFAWDHQTLTFAQDKPLLAPFEPSSYAHVGIPPLSGAGNLWLWRPQLRYDERISLPSYLTATLSAALLETDETYNAVASGTATNGRPAVQSRAELKRSSDGTTTWSIGVGGHASESHSNGKSVASRLVNFDFSAQPAHWLKITGDIFHGQNFANLGAVGPGINVTGAVPRAVHGSGGWGQFSFLATPRLTFNLYGGRQLDRASDITDFQIARTLTIAGNAFYRVAPNVVLGLEVGRSDIDYLAPISIFATRVDATVAYLF